MATLVRERGAVNIRNITFFSRKRSGGIAQIDDDGEICHRALDEDLRTMHRAGVEEQRIAGQQMIGLLSVPVDDLTGEHVDELDAGVAERRVGHGILLQRDQKRLNDDVAAERVTEKLIYVSGLGAAPFDDHSLIGANERTVTALLERGEEVGDWYAERRGDGLDRRERRRDLSVFNLRQHAHRDAGGGGEV